MVTQIAPGRVRGARYNAQPARRMRPRTNSPYGSRGLAGALAGAAVLGVAGWSCTFLVQFHDMSVGCDGASCGEDGGAPEAAPGPDASDGGAVGRDSGVPIEGGADGYAPCSGLANGEYCPNDGLNGYAGSANDLVTCSGGAIAMTTACDAGCVKIPSPFPDACNPCVTEDAGSYCGRDLAGLPMIDGDLLVACQTGSVASVTACKKGCQSSGAASACYP